MPLSPLEAFRLASFGIEYVPQYGTLVYQLEIPHRIMEAAINKLVVALDENAFAEFSAALDSPPTDNPPLRKLLGNLPEWDCGKMSNQNTTTNMYGCTLCPKCKGDYRWPTQLGTVICDDCGFTERATVENCRQIEKGDE